MSSATSKDDFRRSPYPVFLDILRKADGPLTGAEIMDRVVAEYGVPRTQVKKEWEAFRDEAKKHHPGFVKAGTKWAFSTDPAATADAFRSLLEVSPPSRSKIKKWLREEIVHGLRPQFEKPTELERDDDGLLRASRERQFLIDRLRAIAEIAGEVEEMAYSSGDPDIIVEKVQTRVLAADLTQIGRAGEDEPFDPVRHEVIGARPDEGAEVTVVRPGYSWLENGTAVILRRALVAEA